ncbi:MAG: hypothetical protein WA957_16550 [Alteraurantiacibacter sp.]
MAFSSSGWKDSVANVEATGEFVWNLETMAQAQQMNTSSASVGSDVDEFELAGLDALPASLVKPNRVAGYIRPLSHTPSHAAVARRTISELPITNYSRCSGLDSQKGA